jgi:hypothetical protein
MSGWIGYKIPGRLALGLLGQYILTYAIIIILLHYLAAPTTNYTRIRPSPFSSLSFIIWQDSSSSIRVRVNIPINNITFVSSHLLSISASRHLSDLVSAHCLDGLVVLHNTKTPTQLFAPLYSYLLRTVLHSARVLPAPHIDGCVLGTYQPSPCLLDASSDLAIILQGCC